MSKWDIVTLESVCDILDNKRVPITAKDRKSGSYPYYGANGIQDYVDGYIFDDELVLLAEDGGNFGSKDKPIAYRVSGKCWVNNHAHVLKSKDSIDIDYLCYSIMLYDVSGIVNGATRQKLNQADMRKMTIPLPPLPVQKQIASTLDLVTDLINKRNKQLEKLDELVKSRFVEMFGKCKNTEKLEKVCNKITDGEHGTVERLETGRLYLMARNITADNSIDLSEVSYISEDAHNKIFKRCNPEYGDILLVCVGATIGKIAIVPKMEQFSIARSVALIKPNFEVLNSMFLLYAIQSNNVQIQIKNSIHSSAQGGLYTNSIKNLSIIVPPIELQTQFTAFAEATDKSKFKIQKSLEKLETLKKALMQEYFG